MLLFKFGCCRANGTLLSHLLFIIPLEIRQWWDLHKMNLIFYEGSKAKQKYRGMFKIQKSGYKTSKVQRLVSTLENMQFQKWDRTRCLEEYASSVGMPHPLHMFYGNLAQLGKKSNSVIRSRSVMVKNWCNVKRFHLKHYCTACH